MAIKYVGPKQLFYCNADLLPYLDWIKSEINKQRPECIFNVQKVDLCEHSSLFWIKDCIAEYAFTFIDATDAFYIKVYGYHSDNKKNNNIYNVAVKVAYTEKFKILNHMS